MLFWLVLFIGASLVLKLWHDSRSERELRDLKLKSIQRRIADKETAANQAATNTDSHNDSNI